MGAIVIEKYKTDLHSISFPIKKNCKDIGRLCMLHLSSIYLDIPVPYLAA